MAALGVLAGVTIASRAARPAQSDTEFDITSPKRQVSGKKLAGDAKNAARMTMYNMVNSPEMFDELKKIAKGSSMEEMARMSHAKSEDSELSQKQSMDEIMVRSQEYQRKRKERKPHDVLLDLQRGNGRFWMGFAQRPELNAMERRALIIAQAPSVAILGCSDSRVPVEIIFDQGLGDIFTVRNAGNMLEKATHGSIEYAIQHLEVKVVMVLGHEGCGAVKGALTMSHEAIAKEPSQLQFVLKSIKANLPEAELQKVTDARARDREAVVANTTVQMKQLLENPIVKCRVEQGTLLVCGAFYEITSGIVDFFSMGRNGMIEGI
uniref:Carbonic anhydrase n=1 Tax=Eutreptiella gymnastica TaxID=73025 RepID=A0A7S4FS81_9EUGL